MNSVHSGSPRQVRSTTVAVGTTDVVVADRDRTRVFLLLHGGAGPASMTGFADLLAERLQARVLLPTHPGFGGTPRPSGLTATGLAATYVGLLDQLDLADVTVVGNSFGGWLAAEMALLASPRVSGAVIVDAIGVEDPDHPMASVVGLDPDELARLSFHDPSKAPPPPTSGAGLRPDVAALLGYGGPTMSDPTLRDRLAEVDIPVHVVWGESDGIVTPDYGRGVAAAIPGSEFTLLPGTGHLPQVETPEELLGAITVLGRRG